MPTPALLFCCACGCAHPAPRALPLGVGCPTQVALRARAYAPRRLTLPPLLPLSPPCLLRRLEMQRLASTASSVARSARVRVLSTDSRLPTPADSLSGFRTLGSMGPWMRDMPSEVKDLQKFFGHTNAPTYAKGATDKFYNSGIVFFSFAGTLMFAYGCVPPQRTGSGSGGLAQGALQRTPPLSFFGFCSHSFTLLPCHPLPSPRLSLKDMMYGQNKTV